MRYGNTGWCNICSCNSCDCSCGRKTVLQQSAGSCCTSGASANFCKEPIPYVTANFTVPVANVAVEVEVSDSAKLYVGQGVRIGTYYFQVTSIVDSRHVELTHKGTATPGAVMYAKSTAYGCYALPIYYVGIVDIIFSSTDIEGVNASLEVAADSISDPVLSFTYGYLGPKKVQVNITLSVSLGVDAPTLIRIPLPVSNSETVGSLSAYGILGTDRFGLIAFKSGNYIYVGGPGYEGSEVAIIVYINGEYEL